MAKILASLKILDCAAELSAVRDCIRAHTSLTQAMAVNVANRVNKARACNIEQVRHAACVDLNFDIIRMIDGWHLGAKDQDGINKWSADLLAMHDRLFAAYETLQGRNE